MESGNKTKVRGGLRCVAGTLDNKSCCNDSYTKGISIHRFPKDPAVRRQWTKFVRKRRPNFDPREFSNPVLCSDHFEPGCYTRSVASLLEGYDTSKTKRFLQQDAVPTVYVASTGNEGNSTSQSKRERRKGVRDAMNVVSVADTQTDLFEEPLFDEATSSKTDKSQTVFTETSMEATPFVDVSSLSCQDCKAINYLKRKVKKFRESKQGQPTKLVNNMDVEETDSDSDSCKSFAENDDEWNPVGAEDESEDSDEEFVNEEEIDSDENDDDEKVTNETRGNIR
eukprot:gene9983-18607_t